MSPMATTRAGAAVVCCSATTKKSRQGRKRRTNRKRDVISQSLLENHPRLAKLGHLLVDVFAHLVAAGEDGTDRAVVEPRPEGAVEVFPCDSLDAVPQCLVDGLYRRDTLQVGLFGERAGMVDEVQFPVAVVQQVAGVPVDV